jgi:hypothetical protein
VQEVIIEQLRLAEKEKVSLHMKFEEDKEHIQQEKKKILAEKLKVKEAVNKALHSMTGLEPKV